MKVLAVSRHPTTCDDVEFTDTDSLFARADYLTFHCPLTEETRGTANARTLSLMKPSAVLINTARGGVVEEEALAVALNENRLRGAGIDVLDMEPMKPNHPYLTAKNCYVTPHVAWASQEARTRLVKIAADNIKAFLSGSPVNQVNKL